MVQRVPTPSPFTALTSGKIVKRVRKGRGVMSDALGCEHIAAVFEQPLDLLSPLLPSSPPLPPPLPISLTTTPEHVVGSWPCCGRVTTPHHPQTTKKRPPRVNKGGPSHILHGKTRRPPPPTGEGVWACAQRALSPRAASQCGDRRTDIFYKKQTSRGRLGAVGLAGGCEGVCGGCGGGGGPYLW